MVRTIRTRETDVRHQLLVDHPSATTRRRATVPTRCGRFVDQREIAATVDEVTCAKCLRTIELHEQASV